MKKLLLSTITFMCASFLMAQELPVDEKTGKITWIEVIETADVTAKEGYDVAKKFAEGKPLKATMDEAGNKIFYQGRYTVNYPAVRGGISNEGTVEFKLQLFFKDGRIRYIFTDFVHSGKYGSGGELENSKPIDGYGKISERAWNMIRNQTHEKTTAWIEEFKGDIKEFQNDPARSDDW